MNKHNHIYMEEMKSFLHNNMKDDEKEKFLEHICSCDYCSELFAENMYFDVVKAPMNMKDNIMKAVRQPDILLPLKLQEISKRMQLFYYSLKVGAAMIGALILLLLTIGLTSNHTAHSPDLPDKTSYKVSLATVIKENMDSLNNGLQKFSNSIIKTEVIDNEEKEK